jgi:D-alanyl-D-alanine carboxypeptidase (penicillin-binding protein 5/6)
MGGSQVYLEEGESISVEELIKCAVIASANDASVALAELVGGSESSFVKKMNEKAEQLSLVNTYFENTTGLDNTTTNHHSCASDVAVISRELLKHPLILKYSSIWQDSIRDGEMVLTNTNRLIRYYEGCNGLKTGSTDKAGFCISVTAKRQNMQLIAVVLGASTKDERNSDARTLLDFGFANFSLFESAEAYLEKAYVKNGKESYCDLYKTGFSCVVDKTKARKIEEIYEIPEHLSAPVKAGDVVGKITYQIDGEKIGEAEIYAKYDIAQINAIDVFLRLIRKIIVGA